MIRTTMTAVAVSLTGSVLAGCSFLAGWNLAALLAVVAQEVAFR